MGSADDGYESYGEVERGIHGPHMGPADEDLEEQSFCYWQQELDLKEPPNLLAQEVCLDENEKLSLREVESDQIEPPFLLCGDRVE
jgi:hypothetical protein